MRRITANVLILVVPSTTMAGLVLLLGAALPPPTAPATRAGQQGMVTFVDVGTCIEAPTAPFGAPGLAGRATLCDDGHGIRATVEIIGLPPGEEYTAWWIDPGALLTLCRDTSCTGIGTPGDDDTAPMQRVGAASVQPSGILELNGELRDVRLLHDSQITMQVLGERGRGGPYAQASFVVP